MCTAANSRRTRIRYSNLWTAELLGLVLSPSVGINTVLESSHAENFQQTCWATFDLAYEDSIRSRGGVGPVLQTGDVFFLGDGVVDWIGDFQVKYRFGVWW